MICYRDMTFCPFEDCKKFDQCERALAKEVKKRAAEWWGEAGAPVAQFMYKPECFEEEA